jgi:5-methyltetrahydrofolate--homocysteine methyltransferase
MQRPLERVDLPKIQERFDAYWNREMAGRPLISITCPREGAKPPDFPIPDTVERRWTDMEYQCRRAVWQAENTAYLGEAFPTFLPNLGPDSFTAYLGGNLRFLDERTSWVEPFLSELAGFTPTLDRTGRWWRHMMELMDALCEVAEGNVLIGIPDLHGGGDALAAARHPDNLARDLYDEPDEIRRIMPILTGIYKNVFDEYAVRIGRVQEGTTTWIPALSRGRYTALQDDFSGLVSPAMFADFFLPDVRELAGYLDNSLYHLDGPSALGNLLHVLEVDELDGIQWVPGAGRERMMQWLGVCRRVLEAGKCLQIAVAADEVEYILSELHHEGLFITTWTASEAAGRALLERIEGSG